MYTEEIFESLIQIHFGGEKYRGLSKVNLANSA